MFLYTSLMLRYRQNVSYIVCSYITYNLIQVTLFVAAIFGDACDINGVTGVCVALDEHGMGWPGCGTARNVDWMRGIGNEDIS